MPDSPIAVEQHSPELRHHFADMEQQREASSLGMWLFLATEVMFFGGMFCAYLIYRLWYFPEFAAADLARSDLEVVLDIEDDGGPFDPNQVAPPQVPDAVESASVGGRGIHLIRQFSSRMEYARTGGCNRLRLTFAA